MYESIWQGIYTNLISDSRYLLLLDGLKNTLLLSVFSLIIGTGIGFLMAFLRLSKNRGLRMISGIYIDVIRGTPSFVQLLIIYFVVFGSVNINKILSGAIAFGINSGGYVAEIIRAGIQSIDIGQTEAGRSLGLTKAQTMRLVVIPQAIKNILPALANEFIVLIKETSVAGYIAVEELTKAAMMIQSRTYNAFYPLIAIAVIYYIIIKILTILFAQIEKRMRVSDAR